MYCYNSITLSYVLNKLFVHKLCFMSLCFKVQNGATFVKVDKIDIMKDGSPALLFQGIFCLNASRVASTQRWNIWCFVQMMAVEWILNVCENAWAWAIRQRREARQLDNVNVMTIHLFPWHDSPQFCSYCWFGFTIVVLALDSGWSNFFFFLKSSTIWCYLLDN